VKLGSYAMTKSKQLWQSKLVRKDEKILLKIRLENHNI